MNIELKQAAQQAVDAFDAFGDADDFASLFELTQKMRALRTAIQQAAPAVQAEVMDGFVLVNRETIESAMQHVPYRGEVWQELNAAIQAMRAALAQPAECGEVAAWRTFDGEGGYDYRDFEGNENYASEWERLNPRHKGWVEPLYTAPLASQEPFGCTDCAETDEGAIALYEHLSTSQEPALFLGACITDGKLHATVNRYEANGNVTCLATAEMDAASLFVDGCGTQMTASQAQQYSETLQDVIQERFDLLHLLMPDDPREAVSMLVRAEIAIALNQDVSGL